MVARRVNTRRGDIAYVDLDPTKGSEQAGRRPVLVISNDHYNKKTPMRIVCPITTKGKGWPFEVELKTGKTYGCVLVDQMRCLDLKVRNAEISDQAPSDTVQEVQAKLEALLL